MKVVNIITIRDNQVENILSFRLFEDGPMKSFIPDINKNIENDIKTAFVKEINRRTLAIIEEDEIETYLKDGVFEGDNGYVVTITISDLI